jgi:hypothetical protein
MLGHIVHAFDSAEQFLESAHLNDIVRDLGCADAGDEWP